MRLSPKINVLHDWHLRDGNLAKYSTYVPILIMGLSVDTKATGPEANIYTTTVYSGGIRSHDPYDPIYPIWGECMYVCMYG
jgi:hypothetical protein